MKQYKKGFTLIELLVVIAIIAILAIIVLVALNPGQRFADSRDAVRAADAVELLSAIKLDQVDNGGDYLPEIAQLASGGVYMIAATNTGCDDYNQWCETNVEGETNCINLSDLITEGYIAEIPVSPEGEFLWNTLYTGYTIERDAQDVVHIRSCESENTTEIEAAR
ncbi:hypothetical protein A2239_01690 [Candidatus Uhrbacteria bacterium RIFOXYA2_FULL_40_9]|nr:MAG: hypothetical protein A2239_01690 [Candidatus Uhrbacteria bacterium RIFOXYA2_FULL_40_9]OGL96875.1 MAG: hypothetical protein A2332_02025 [Candidatus Uhrbacteria bacterium RIFOXYB2_FULL_41_18]